MSGGHAAVATRATAADLDLELLRAEVRALGQVVGQLVAGQTETMTTLALLARRAAEQSDRTRR